MIPAIDIKSGLCVRLYQGDYAKGTVYSDDPVSVALRWQDEGAPRLHVVDLDGAAEGRLVNLDIVRGIVRAVAVPVQVGGGVREMEVAESLLDAGVDRVVLGTAAVRDPGLVERLCGLRGSDRVVVAADSRGGQVSIRGWTEATTISPLDLVTRMAQLGVRRFLFTDISRDGTLTEPNFEALEELVRATGYRFLASGGVTSVGHVERLAALGAEGVILGVALYSGAIRLEDAIKAAG